VSEALILCKSESQGTLRQVVPATSGGCVFMAGQVVQGLDAGLVEELRPGGPDLTSASGHAMAVTKC
jgi:hypothetical protein